MNIKTEKIKGRELVVRQEIIYACGCSWTREYSRGATKTEAKRTDSIERIKICPKCHDLLIAVRKINDSWKLGLDVIKSPCFTVIGNFTRQKPVTDEPALGYSAGEIGVYKDGSFAVNYQQSGAEETFSISQPMYDLENNLVGYLGIGCYYNLDYCVESDLHKREKIPAYYWSIEKPTEYCKPGVAVQTYWQRWREDRDGA